MYTLVISKALHHDSSYPSSALADVMWADMLISCSRVSASAAHKAGERAGAWLGLVVKPTLHCLYGAPVGRAVSGGITLECCVDIA